MGVLPKNYGAILLVACLYKKNYCEFPCKLAFANLLWNSYKSQDLID